MPHHGVVLVSTRRYFCTLYLFCAKPTLSAFYLCDGGWDAPPWHGHCLGACLFFSILFAINSSAKLGVILTFAQAKDKNFNENKNKLNKKLKNKYKRKWQY